MIRNVHERHLKADPKTVWSIVASLSSRHDELWPRERWPAMRFDGPLAGGARGGHGPVRYEVAQMRAPHSVAFRFTPDFGIRGEHRCEVEPRGEGAVLRHVLEGRPVGAMHFLWPLFFRPLHDALIEDALDRAEAHVSGGEKLVRRSTGRRPACAPPAGWQPRRLSLRVRVLRRLARPPQLRHKPAVVAADGAKRGRAAT